MNEADDILLSSTLGFVWFYIIPHECPGTLWQARMAMENHPQIGKKCPLPGWLPEGKYEWQ
jgi:hypothetical protein